MPELSSFRLIGSGGANRAMEAELKRIAKRLGLARELPKAKRVGTRLDTRRKAGSSQGGSDAGAKRKANGALATKPCHWKAAAPIAQASSAPPCRTQPS